MSLSAGERSWPYAIVGAIGAGGMVEVYRARDTKLDREVALKVLPEAFASDAERMARLRREAKLLASLVEIYEVRQDEIIVFESCTERSGGR